MLVLGLVLPAFAHETYIVGVSDEVFRGGGFIDGRRLRTIRGSSELEDLLSTRPGTEIFMAFSSRDFVWNGGRLGPDITPDIIRQQHIRVHIPYHNADGVRILHSARIEEFAGLTGVMFRFADTLASLEPVEFELIGSISTAGHSSGASGHFTISGTLRNQSVIITESSRYVRLGAGRVGVVSGLPPQSAVFDLGSGVTITASLDRFQHMVYGIAREGALTADTRERFPAVERVITVQTIGIESGQVSFALDNTYFVYGPGMRFIGMSNSALPLHGRYYLSRVAL